MVTKILWKSPKLPVRALEDDEWILRMRDRAQELFQTDAPSASDLRYALNRYNQSTPSERDAMDAVFVWFTGYTLATLATMTKANDSPDKTKMET